MTSALKKKTNRSNAQASTGPKTAYGKVRSAQNAFRHGLSIAVGSTLARSNQIEAIAQQLVGKTINFEILECARRVAEAQVDVRRIREARYYLMASVMGSATADRPAQNTQRQDPKDAINGIAELAKQLLRINRYERRAISRRKFAIREFYLAHRQLTDAGNGVAGIDLDKRDR
jgi:hypothetical protein